MNTTIEEQLDSLQAAFKDAQAKREDARESLIFISNLLKEVISHG